MYYTLNKSKLDINELNKERIKIFLNKGLLSEKKVNVVIDDTSRMKEGKGELFSRGYIGNVGKVDVGCNLVSLSFVNQEIIEPFDGKFYISANKYERGKLDSSFKTKIDLSRDLLLEAEDSLKRHGKELGKVLSDSFYGSSENLNDLNKKGYEYFIGIKSNRVLKYNKGENLRCFVTALKSKSSPYTKDYFKVYSSLLEVKGINHSLKVFSIKTREKERLYVTNDLNLSDEEALELHLERSHIDVKEYKELKTELHLLDCRYQTTEGYNRHVKLVYLCFDILRSLAIKILKSPKFGLKLFIHQLCTT